MYIGSSCPPCMHRDADATGMVGGTMRRTISCTAPAHVCARPGSAPIDAVPRQCIARRRVPYGSTWRPIRTSSHAGRGHVERWRAARHARHRARWASEEERRTTHVRICRRRVEAFGVHARTWRIGSVGGRTIRVQRAARPGVAGAIHGVMFGVCAIMRHGPGSASMWTDVGPGVAPTQRHASRLRQRRRHCSRMPRRRSPIRGASLTTRSSEGSHRP